MAPPPAKRVAERLGVPVLQPERLDGGVELAADVVVAVAYGVLVPEKLLDRTLWLNVHPSLLPRWRGAARVERAIMAGDRETGVTVIKLVRELDAGPIAAQRAFEVAPDDDAGAVYAKAAGVAAELLADVLASPRFRPQPSEGVTYAHKITADDRRIDWSRAPDEVVNQVRALSPHIGARGDVEGRRLTVGRARPARPDSALVAGGLDLLEVQPEGKRRMTGAEFVRGLRNP